MKRPRFEESNMSTEKRSKVEANMRPGDWFCSSCGNHNFASRVTCRKCHTPKPNTGLPVHAGGFGVQGGQNFEMYAPYGAGMGKYTNGPLYGQQAQVLDAYGFVQQGGGMMAANPAMPPNSRPGDWMCTNCGEHNFASRSSCRKCGTSKLVPGGGNFPARIGDWACPNCGEHNFATRTKCRKCNTAKPAQAAGSGSRNGQAGQTPVPGLEHIPYARGGDWLCSACGAHNYASRGMCFKCKAPKPSTRHEDVQSGESK